MAFLLSLRGVITISYSDELSLVVRVLFIKINLLKKKESKRRSHSMSRKKSDRIEKKLHQKQEKKRLKKERKKEKKESSREDSKKSSFTEIIDTVNLTASVIKTALGGFFGHLRVDVARFKITVATGYAASTAIAYGAVSQAVSYLLAILKSNKNVRGINKADVDIVCDFLGERSSADIKLSFSLRVWHILHIALISLLKLIRHKFDKLKKDDAQRSHNENKNSI